jgi:hypothetical protein
MPHRPAAVSRAPTASACERFHELIAEALSRGRNAIWQDLRTSRMTTGSAASTPACADVANLRGVTPAEARV